MNADTHTHAHCMHTHIQYCNTLCFMKDANVWLGVICDTHLYTKKTQTHVCVCVCVCTRVCVIIVCACVRVYACVYERERERERGRAIVREIE